MKTTIDLPDALVFQVKLRALRDGRKLKETVAELLKKGLASAETELQPFDEAQIEIDERTGLAVIVGGHPAPPGRELTDERVAQILLDQEAERYTNAR